MANTGLYMTEQEESEKRRLRLSYQDRLLVDMRVRSAQPKPVFAYTLCICLGFLGAHRFYLGDPKGGLIMLAIGITVIGLPVTLVWAFTDLFRVKDMIRSSTQRLRERLTAEARAAAG